MNGSHSAACWALCKGDPVTIRRTSGAHQRAVVSWLSPDRLYRAPEVHSFDVEFVDSDGRLKVRGCCAFDIVLDAERDSIDALLDAFAGRA